LFPHRETGGVAARHQQGRGYDCRQQNGFFHIFGFLLLLFCCFRRVTGFDSRTLSLPASLALIDKTSAGIVCINA
jgi:hypothetical protein